MKKLSFAKNVKRNGTSNNLRRPSVFDCTRYSHRCFPPELFRIEALVAVPLVKEDEAGLCVPDGRQRADSRAGLGSVLCLRSGLGRCRSSAEQFYTWSHSQTISQQSPLLTQINYLDEHDVNAFEVIADGNPFLLCTTMTHTPGATTTKVTMSGLNTQHTLIFWKMAIFWDSLLKIAFLLELGLTNKLMGLTNVNMC